MIYNMIWGKNINMNKKNQKSAFYRKIKRNLPFIVVFCCVVNCFVHVGETEQSRVHCRDEQYMVYAGSLCIPNIMLMKKKMLISPSVTGLNDAAFC